MVVDRVRIDAEMRAGMKAPDETNSAGRREWLAKRLALRHVKETTLDVAAVLRSTINATEQEAPQPVAHSKPRSRSAGREIDHAF